MAADARAAMELLGKGQPVDDPLGSDAEEAGESQLPRQEGSLDLASAVQEMKVFTAGPPRSPRGSLPLGSASEAQGVQGRAASAAYVAHWSEELVDKEASLREHGLHVMRAEKALQEYHRQLEAWRQAAGGVAEGSLEATALPALPPLPAIPTLTSLGLVRRTSREAVSRDVGSPTSHRKPEEAAGIGPKRQVRISEADQQLIALMSPTADQATGIEASFGQSATHKTLLPPAQAALPAAPALWTDEERSHGDASDTDSLMASVDDLPTVVPGEADEEEEEEEAEVVVGAKEETEPAAATREPVGRSSLFGDEEAASSSLLSRMIQDGGNHSNPNVSRRSEEALDIRRVLSTEDISSCIIDDDYHKPAQHPEELKRLTGQIEGLGEVLQPSRSLVFKFSAIVHLPASAVAPTSPRSDSKKKSFLRRSSAAKPAGKEAKVSSKCLVLLFDDMVCICTRARVAMRLPLFELWLRTDSLFGSTKDGVPFRFVTPERQTVAYLNEEAKVQRFEAVFQKALAKRLERCGRSVPGDPLRRRLRYDFGSGATYDGEWKAGRFSGKGVHTLPNGDRYEGTFTNGKRHGHGDLIYADGKRYEGHWRLGKRHGKGSLVYGNTDEYASKFVGTWSEGLQHGEGELHLLSGKKLKTIWRLGHPTYPAVLHWPSGARYVGDLSEDYLRDGFGICVYQNADRYYGSWAADSRHGRGMFVTAKGTEYNGEWSNDLMEGKGTLRFASDESTFYGKFSGDWNEVLEVTGNFRLSQADSARTLRMSTNRGDKWDCFFSMRLLNDEQSEQAVVLNEMINRPRVKSAEGTAGGPLGGIEEEETSLKDDLKKILYCRNHPLGKLLAEFASIMEALYYRPEEHYMHLATAVDDLQAFMKLMSGSFIRKFLGCSALANEECGEMLQLVLFPEIYSTLFSLYNLKFQEQNSVIEASMKAMLEVPLRRRMHLCGIDERYHQPIEEMIERDIELKAIDLSPSADLTPFQGAVNALRELSVQQTVDGKLSCIKQAATSVETLLKKLMDQFGADEFLPMFCFAMLHAGMPNLYSECSFMDDFMEDDLRFSVYGYMLAQLQVAAGFFTNTTV